jgi:hypothetical protein
VNQFHVKTVLFEMAGVVCNPGNCLIDGDRAIGEAKRCSFAGLRAEKIGGNKENGNENGCSCDEAKKKSFHYCSQFLFVKGGRNKIDAARVFAFIALGFIAGQIKLPTYLKISPQPSIRALRYSGTRFIRFPE